MEAIISGGRTYDVTLRFLRGNRLGMLRAISIKPINSPENTLEFGFVLIVRLPGIATVVVRL